MSGVVLRKDRQTGCRKTALFS
jgi:uncharacterized protein with FMN-binding domain